MLLFSALLAFVAIGCDAQQQGPRTAEVQSDTWQAPPGSPWHNQAATIINNSRVDNATKRAVQIAIDFERSNWARFSIYDDPFYRVPTNSGAAEPGTLLKVEPKTNVSDYTTPPGVALSRIVYQSEDVNGSAVPASAFVLWPYVPAKFPNRTGIPVVAWGHGTSGDTPECAPSHIKNLWYQFAGPFTLALQGYAVVAPDYVGLGVPYYADGRQTTHQWLASAAGANDVVYAVKAAQTAWPKMLSKDFVAAGHSQGGGIAWAVAQRQKQNPTPGYLGAVAGSPPAPLNQFSALPLMNVALQLSYWNKTMTSLFSDFDIAQWMTQAGIDATKLRSDLGGCQSVTVEVLSPTGDYVKPDWNQTYYLPALQKLAGVGDEQIAGPMLVLQGTADMTVNPKFTTDSVNNTCKISPKENIQYHIFENVTHVPVMYTGQQIYLQWIADRFNNVSIKPACETTYHKPPSFFSTSDYQEEIQYFLEYPMYPYETA